jgi:regulator of replication initiation timing
METFVNNLRIQKKNLRTKIEDIYRKNYFFQIHNKIIKQQLQKHLNKTTVEEDIKNTKDIKLVIKY